MNFLKQTVKDQASTKTIKPKNSYTFTKRILDLGNGRQASSEYIYQDIANGQFTGDSAPVVGGRTIYYSPEKNDTLYWMNELPYRMVGYSHGYFPVPDASKDQEKAKSNFYKVIKWATPENNENSRAARHRALQGKKQGGQIENQKFQQGGTVSQQANSEQDAVMQFVQALAQTLNADPNQIIQYAQANPNALESAVKVYQQTQDMNQAAQAFAQAVQSQTQAVRHGAKLNYLKSLKNKCAEDEELVYFKRGGKVDCGCVKKEQDGGKAPQKKESPVMKFKKTVVKKDQTSKESPKLDPKTTKRLPNGKYPSNWTADDKTVWEREYGAKDEGAHHTDPIKKNCGGSKLKLVKKGGEVCPKCGKVHKVGMGCSVASFKNRKK